MAQASAPMSNRFFSRLSRRATLSSDRTLTFLAALSCDRLTAPCVIDGPINGASFRAYVEQVLLPALAPGDIVVRSDPDLPGGVELRPAHRALRHRRTDQWRKLPRLCRTGSSPGSRAGRHCRQIGP